MTFHEKYVSVNSWFPESFLLDALPKQLVMLQARS